VKNRLWVALVLLWAAPAWAQTCLPPSCLTPAQQATLKAAIVADATANALYQNGDLSGLAAHYNATASPTFTVWRTRVPLNPDIATGIDSAELAGLSTLNATRLQTLVVLLGTGNQAVNPSIGAAGGTNKMKTFFDDIFSGAGGANTRAALALVWYRSATRIEKLFATGTGTTGSPAVLYGAVPGPALESPVSYTIFQNLP
jgi:hypothetical protein